MLSPVESALGTNYIPSDEDCALVTEYLVFAEKEAAELDDQILRQKFPLQTLEKQREDQQANIQAHRAIISPFRRFPDDILREIFIRCLPHLHNATLCASDAPILLGRICRRWRQLALSTPHLWSSLHIVSYADEENPSDIKLQARDSIVAEWIARSGAFPLSLSFVPPNLPALARFSRRNCKDMTRLLQSISQFAPRLRNLYICLRGFTRDIRKLQGATSADLYCRAENLDLHLDLAMTHSHHRFLNTEEYNMHFGQMLSHFDLARSTRLHLKLWSYLSTSFGQLPQLIPCAQLQHLIVTKSIYLAEVLELLRHSPNLTVFEVSIETSPVQTTPPQAPTVDDKIIVKGLKHISLTLPDLGDPSGVDFVAKCHFPSLTSLHLSTHVPSERFHVLSIIADQFAASLTSLKVNLKDLSNDALIAFLSFCPSLIQLELGDPNGGPDSSDEDHDHGDDVFIESLTPKEDGVTPYSCPHLQYFKFAPGHSFARFSDKALATLIFARSSSAYSPVGLKQVRGQFLRPKQHEILPELSELVGLDLKLQYGLFPVLSGSSVQLVDPKTDIEAQEDILLFGWN